MGKILRNWKFWNCRRILDIYRNWLLITFDTPASEKTHDENKNVRMTNLVVMSSQARESQYRSFKVKGLREATTNYLDCDN